MRKHLSILAAVICAWSGEVQAGAQEEPDMSNPKSTVQTMFDAFNERDLDAVVACFEPEAVFVVEPGQTVSGSEEIRAAFKKVMETGVRLVLEKGVVLGQSDDIALFSALWRSEDPEAGEGAEIQSASMDVLRRQADGTWRFVIDNPWGSPLEP